MSLTSITSLERDAIQYRQDVERFTDPTLTKQRAVLNEEKELEQATLAVCAKIEKAIGRRLSLQDAEFSPKKKSLPQQHSALNEAHEANEKQAMR